MDPRDIDTYRRRYGEWLREHGYSPRSLGWGVNGRQQIRFDVAASVILAAPSSSVLDVGCGFADLYQHLRGRGWNGKYVGIDINAELLAVARERNPGIELRELDIAAAHAELPRFDFVVASGTFNARLEHGDNQAHIELSLRRMAEIADQAVSVDFLSTYVDFQRPEAWHTDPCWAFGFAKTISRFVTLRHDFLPFEFALYLFTRDPEPQS